MEWLENLKILKDNTNETYKSIAEKTNISQSTIEKIFSGRTNDPKLNMIKDIVHCLGYSLDDLLPDDNINSKKQKTNLTSLDEEFINHIHNLNDLGQRRLIEYINLLLLDDKYKKLPQNIPEANYEMAAFGGKDTKGTIPKPTEETTAN